MVYDSGLQALASNHMSTGPLAVIPVGLSSPSVLLLFIETEALRREFMGVSGVLSGRQSCDHAF